MEEEENGTDVAYEIESLLVESILSTENGREFFNRLFEELALSDAVFVNDPYGLAFNEGMRHAAVIIRDKFKMLAPELYKQMIRESVENG